MYAFTNHQSSQLRLLTLFAAVLLGLLFTLSGCGDGLAGDKYVEDNGNDGIEFRSNNKAYLTMMGNTVEVDYVVDDDKIKLDTHGMGGTMVLTRQTDGTLTGLPLSGPLKKAE